jgi:hypothetical protein
MSPGQNITFICFSQYAKMIMDTPNVFVTHGYFFLPQATVNCTKLRSARVFTPINVSTRISSNFLTL